MLDSSRSRQDQILQCYKEMDDIFHVYAVEHGLSDSAFWILYTLCQAEKTYTQNDFCEEWYYPKQTVHSAVAGLIKTGYVTLEHVPGSRNIKGIVLTAKGSEYSDAHIQPIVTAERRAFAQLSEEEQAIYFRLVRKHLDLFDREVKGLKT